MTAKEYLREIRKYRASKIRLQRRIKELNEDLFNIGGFDYSRDKIKNDLPKDPLSDQVIKLIELQRKYIKTVEIYNRELEEREKKIDGLDNDRNKEILKLVYIDGMTLSEVTEEMGYTYNWACHVHGLALQEFTKKYIK